ncbi:MAG: 3-deoxy-manno-octulosonate cytidylyltransferase [Planctomycetaceae bacterium]|jgi:3-deoxy-manno-octulosonate cytidylyltransferase (CMP-KDO synthetase)|nr:3-deoxy-manno-octulosonate cytidylyltransferase [Planctomycetaceae bacterium]MBT6153642.1 3-deoxy-manno-octulosonate cytidylyltransferase [Planctomycetaceae bacterium]MBT6484307.1 3-deoxy-manno-octulosonate cytidylyltransferase [Planctomycetaceae bacterium]MBT6496663.1 3-deoxy-manno-octulosonate cytidylyltransferase [Planctomycetaceae bacterium]
MRTVGIIPARLQSTRLPRKLLLDETGRPLVQYTWEAACKAESLDEVIVATDSPEIAASVRAFGGRAEITGEHPSGTDRIAEIARRCCPEAEILVNVQGDEPEIDPAQIDTLVALVANYTDSEMATLATPIPTITDRDDPACVKVVIAADGRALYFSRAPIPFVRDAADSPSQSPWLLHLGIYAYRREFLLQLTQLPPSRLEQLEKLEQLRALEAGALIRVGIVDHPAVGIDTPEDYARFVQRELDRAA